MRPNFRNPDHHADPLTRLGVRFSATVPITSQMVAEGGNMQALGGPAESPPVAAGVAMPGGRSHATNVHVGLWMGGAALLIAAWHFSGFRMAFDVGMGRG